MISRFLFILFFVSAGTSIKAQTRIDVTDAQIARIEDLIKENFLISFYHRNLNIENNTLKDMNDLRIPCKDYSVDFKYELIDSLKFEDNILVKFTPSARLICNQRDEQYVFDNKEQQRLYGSGKPVLIGFKPTENNELAISFLSGDLIQSRYAKSFIKIGEFDSISAYYNYLKLKLFSENIEDLNFEKKRRGFLLFSATKTIFQKKKKVYYQINIKDPNIVTYLGTKKSGKYSEREKRKKYFGEID